MLRCIGMLSAVICCAMAALASAAERPLFLITPQGVYQSNVVNGVPGPWVSISADVIVQGFSDAPIPPGPDVPPPVSDPVVKQVQTISKAVLKSTDEAVAVGALLDSIVKLGLNQTDFKQAIEMSAPIVDQGVNADGRIVQWSKQCLAVTADATKLKAGLLAAFEVPAGTFEDIQSAIENPAEPATEKAVNFLVIIQIIKMILELLKNLGIGVK